jgi:serine/threonine protein kinase
LVLKLPEGPPSGELVPFGKYDLMGQIGRGGMADVYLGRPRGQRRLVAIKCMKGKLAARQQFVDMFIQEGKLAVQLNHDSIVKTYEIGRIHGIYFICMEYISGVDLSIVLRSCYTSKDARLPIPHALHIGVRVLEGLHYAHQLRDAKGHSLNVVNRDVSPSNIRTSFEGDVKLLDFGIAKAASGMTSEIGVLKGKISHMSPEQVRGLPLDRRSDIFSVSVVIHEMLTGEKLFRGDSDFRVMDLVRKAEVPAPSKANQRVPKDLDAAVLRGLQKLPADRYQTAEEMAQDLRGILAAYNFTKAELRELVREICAEDWEREQKVEAILETSQEEEPAKPPATPDENYGDLYVESYEKPKKKYPKWIYALLGLAVATLLLAVILVIVL